MSGKSRPASASSRRGGSRWRPHRARPPRPAPPPARAAFPPPTVQRVQGVLGDLPNAPRRAVASQVGPVIDLVGVGQLVPERAVAPGLIGQARDGRGGGGPPAG